MTIDTVKPYRKVFLAGMPGLPFRKGVTAGVGTEFMAAVVSGVGFGAAGPLRLRLSW